MRLRTGTIDDADAIGRVHALSRKSAYVGLVPAEALADLTPQSQASYWRERLTTEPDPHALHVVEADGTVVGFAMGDGDGETATLDAIHVLPDLLGSGAGVLLHDALLLDFTSWGCTRAQLWVLDGNERAQAFYRKHGWRADGGRDSHVIAGVEVPILRYVRPITSC